MDRTRVCLCLSVLRLSPVVLAEEARGDRKTEIILEAEDFQGRGWQVSNMGYCWGAPHLWSKAKLEADASDRPASASRKLGIPKAGRFALWVHYEDIAGHDAWFTVRVEQRGKERLRAEFGRKETSKFIPFGPSPFTRHELRWWYHHGDLVYERAEVDLEAGPATFLLEKGKNGPSPCRRFVDFLLLTDDLDDNPIKAGSIGWFENFINRTGPTNRVFIRLSLPADAEAPVAVHGVTPWPHQPPYYYYGQGFYGPDARDSAPAYGVPDPKRFLRPGQSTPWFPVPLRTTGDNLHRLTAWPGNEHQLGQVRTHYPAQSELAKLITKPRTLQGLRIELAKQPDGSQPLRTFTVDQRVAEFGLFFTRDCRRPEHVATWDEISARRRQWIADAKPVGRLPKRFPISLEFWQLHDQPGIRRLLGETWPAIGDILDRKAMEQHGFSGFKVNWYVGYVGLPSQKLYDDYRELSRKRQKQFEDAGVGAGYPKIMKLIDEPSMWPLDAMRKHEALHEGFRRYVKSLRLAPEKFLDAEALEKVAAAARKGEKLSDDQLLAMVRLGRMEDAAWNSELYYHSQRYRANAFGDYYRPYSQICHEVYGKECFGAPVNLAPNKFALEQGWLDGVDYVDFFRSGGSTMMLSESWHDNVPALVSQTDAVMMDLWRCAAKYDGCRFGQYAICDSNRSITGISTALKAATIVSHGASYLDYYCGEGAYPGSTDGPILEQKDLFQEITRLNYALGEVEDTFLTGRLPKADVALLWNRTSMIWDSAPQRRNYGDEWFNVYMMEFQWLHLVLRHAGYWVDILTEDDCAEGRLKGYRALYLVGEHVQSNAAEAIRQWVENGGALFSPAGGGLKDEYSLPLPTLLPVYGIVSAPLERIHQTMNLKLELPRQAPVDELNPTAAGRNHGLVTMPAIAFRQPLVLPKEKPATTEVLAMFTDRQAPAMVLSRYGKGTCILCGTLPGAAYLKSSVPVGLFSRSLEPDDLMDFRPSKFADSVRDLATLPLRLAQMTPLAVCDPPYVEAIPWETDTHYLLALINHSGQPLPKVTVALHGLSPISSARSQQQSKLTMRSDGDKLLLGLPLRLYDFVLLSRGSER